MRIAPRNVAAKVAAWSSCSGNSTQTGGRNASAVQRTTAAAPPKTINVSGAKRSVQRARKIRNATSVATPTDHRLLVSVPDMPCSLIQISDPKA